MTEIDAMRFIETEILPRYRDGKLTDAGRSDWVRALLLCPVDRARALIRRIVDDPERTLTVKSFRQCLGQTFAGHGRMIYGWPGDKLRHHNLPSEIQPLEVWFVRPKCRARARMMVPIAEAQKDNTVRFIQWTPDLLTAALQKTLEDWNAHYKSSVDDRWEIHICAPAPVVKGPVAGKPLPKATLREVNEPPPHIPSRTELDALVDTNPLNDSHNAPGLFPTLNGAGNSTAPATGQGQALLDRVARPTYAGQAIVKADFDELNAQARAEEGVIAHG